MRVSALCIAFVSARALAAPATPPAPDTATASATEPVPPPEPGTTRTTVPEPPPVATALPGQESGRVDTLPSDSTARVIARGALVVPKWLLMAVLAPVQAGVWAYDRYQLTDRYYETFYNADRTFGIVPTGAYATGLGVVAGANLILTDTFGQNERLDVVGTWGGTYRLVTGAWLDSGTRFGPVQLRVGGNFSRFPNLRFYGIGNSDRTSAPRNGMLIDPLINPTAVKTFNRYQEGRAMTSAWFDIVDQLSFIAYGAYMNLQYAPSTTNPSIQTVYNPADLVGFETGVSQLYGEGELRWDARKPLAPWDPADVHLVGPYASGFGGFVGGLGSSSSFWHYGLDLQYSFRLPRGPRTLLFRFYGEGVTGSVDEVPFSELPHLGGDFLRGYEHQRFRDRVAAFGTVQYNWDVSRWADVYLFVDVGRVYPSLDDVTLEGLRAGFGPGITLHSNKDFLFEAFVGTSIDGGIVASAAFTPIVNRRTRWRCTGWHSCD